MNVRELPQQANPRYGIDPYLDWLKGEGNPADGGLRRLSVRRPDRAVAAIWRQRRGGASQGTRRFLQHVPV